MGEIYERFNRKLKKNLADFGQDESGMGVIEVILIILVLVGLALIFKKQIGDIADGIFTSIKTQVGKF